MYLIGNSTPDRAVICVTARTHKNLIRFWGRSFENYSIWHVGIRGARYVGYFNADAGIVYGVKK